MKLFSSVQKFNLDYSVVYFVATLFILNFACCFGRKQSDKRYLFAKLSIDKMSDDEKGYIKKSLILRKYEAWQDVSNYKQGFEVLTNYLK